MRAILGLVVLAACGSTAGKSTTTEVPRPVITTAADKILPLLPDGAQVVIEVDLARLRANALVGPLVIKALSTDGLPALPGYVPMSPLSTAEAIVLASYGVGTPNAATLTIVATKQPVPGGTRLAEDLVALGPSEWTAQLEARAAIGGLGLGARSNEEIADAYASAGIAASPELLRLRDHAMPPKAPGASLRITARLPFDARVSLARQTGLPSAPAQVSVWADVVDDFAIVVDADAADPGDNKTGRAAKQLEASVRGLLAAAAAEPAVKLLGIPASLNNAKTIAQGTWVRTIIAIGPERLQRVVQRATAYLDTQPAKPTASPDAKPEGTL
ncbi:MAG: hypothetical protein SFX73_28355 [Kofleriaceae bacterium]|nr:hypothetical protein [Kofleriaceae bacterium]